MFAKWDAPRKAAIAVTALAGFVGFVPQPPAQAAPVFTQFSRPSVVKPVPVVWQFSITAPQTQTTVFSRFSDPPQLKAVPAGFTNAPQPAFFQPYVFSQFSQITAKSLIPLEQPNTLFEVEPPELPPFTGFARFENVQRAKLNIALFSDFRFLPPPIVVDTHDGVWVKKKRKRLGPDPIELELAEKAARRTALELAIYGPEVEYKTPEPVFVAPTQPVDVTELAKVVAQVQAANQEAIRTQQDQDEEADLETILREIL